jgi:hypothetical protein
MATDTVHRPAPVQAGCPSGATSRGEAKGTILGWRKRWRRILRRFRALLGRLRSFTIAAGLSASAKRPWR